MAMRAASSPGCGVMHNTPISALSSEFKTSAGAAAIGRGPKSSSRRPVQCALRSSSAAEMLAATARLASSAISATCSPARTLRHVFTALRAPGINSGLKAPKSIQTILLESREFSSDVVFVGHFFHWPMGRANPSARSHTLVGGVAPGGNPKRGHLPAAAGNVGESGRAEPRQKAAQFSPKQVRRKVHQHIAVVHTARLRDIREDFAANGNPLLHDPCAVFRREGASDSFIPSGFAGFPSQCDAGAAIFVAGLEHQVLKPSDEYGGSDRKSTRLNSSHRCISYAVFCLK